MTPHMWNNPRTAAGTRRYARSPTPARWQRGRVAVRSAMCGGKGMPAIPRPQENEGVGEHVRTRFHLGPKASREIAEPLRRTAPNEENSFLLPDREKERSDR